MFLFLVPSRGRRRSKKVCSRLRSVTPKRYQGHFSVTAFKKTVQFIMFVTVTVGPFTFLNREPEIVPNERPLTKIEIWVLCFEKNTGPVL